VAVPGIAANLRHFAIVDPWPRVAVGQFAMNADPTYANGELWYTALTDSGYRTRSAHGGSIGPADADSFHPTAGGKGEVWIETVRRRSQIFEYANYGAGPAKYVTDGASPVVSPDERWLAFLRDDGSQAQLWIRSLADGSEFPVRLPGYEILEASLSQAEVVFAAQRGLEISLFRQALCPAAGPQPILTGRVRYPAISPDRRHLAFSRWSRGTWHLWIRNLPTGEGRQMTFADCNAVTPAWSDDGRTLFYASDCGRLGLTTLRAIPVVPAQ
ncbi:MAG TPA: hypothetical protein VFU76_05245, partial [Terriglobales bacterium]|nr:hypothetical protein [Terriglobales bacterium]